jgi:hypothetical protein
MKANISIVMECACEGNISIDRSFAKAVETRHAFILTAHPGIAAARSIARKKKNIRFTSS